MPSLVIHALFLHHVEMHRAQSSVACRPNRAPSDSHLALSVPHSMLFLACTCMHVPNHYIKPPYVQSDIDCVNASARQRPCMPAKCGRFDATAPPPCGHAYGREGRMIGTIEQQDEELGMVSGL